MAIVKNLTIKHVRQAISKRCSTVSRFVSKIHQIHQIQMIQNQPNPPNPNPPNPPSGCEQGAQYCENPPNEKACPSGYYRTFYKGQEICVKNNPDPNNPNPNDPNTNPNANPNPPTNRIQT
jgi:hypothetical protein